MEPQSVILSLLFTAGEPVPLAELSRVLELSPEQVKAHTDALMERLKNEKAGVVLRYINDSAQLATDPENAPYIQKLLQTTKTMSFSQSLLETLSIIAYKQPVTRAEIEAIRGVRCEYSVSALLRLDMIREVGRREVVGRPALFGTTEKFLMHFNLSSLDDLPERAGILDEADAALSAEEFRTI